MKQSLIAWRSGCVMDCQATAQGLIPLIDIGICMGIIVMSLVPNEQKKIQCVLLLYDITLSDMLIIIIYIKCYI